MTETLQEYLAAGGRLNFDVDRELIDATASPMSDDERADRAVKARYDHETLLDGGEPVPGRHLTDAQRAEITRATGFLADYLESAPDPELDKLIHAALPEPLALHLEDLTVPHRIHVGRPGGVFWSCDSCGATFEAADDRALMITDRPGHSSLHRDIVVCADCVRAAAAELEPGATA